MSGMDDFIAPLAHRDGDLVLRAWQPGDGPALATTANASYDHLSPWMAWAVADDTPEAAEVRVRRFAAAYLTNEDFGLSAWLDGQLVGATGFHLRWGGLDAGIAEIGMWVAGSHAGRGLGTRILRTLVDWAFSDAWPWQRLVWTCDPANVASTRVAARAGFVHEATLRGSTGHGTGRDATLVYGLMREDRTTAKGE